MKWTPLVASLELFKCRVYIDFWPIFARWQTLFKVKLTRNNLSRMIYFYRQTMFILKHMSPRKIPPIHLYKIKKTLSKAIYRNKMYFWQNYCVPATGNNSYGFVQKFTWFRITPYTTAVVTYHLQYHVRPAAGTLSGGNRSMPVMASGDDALCVSLQPTA